MSQREAKFILDFINKTSIQEVVVIKEEEGEFANKNILLSIKLADVL